ncbi:MAG: threonine synthase [Oscillospiraceae bacterium]|nr:threonine synthase [Oscillospiraceae bacterium]
MNNITNITNITYQSTRDAKNAEKLPCAQVIKQGMARSGGLFMPSEIVGTDKKTIESFIEADYDEIASHILSLYLTDYKRSDIEKISKQAYSKANFPDGAAKTKKVTDKISVLELYHGPTSAFKDMALQIMPLLLKKAFDITGEKRKALILVATSGDTGKAALEGTKNIGGIETLVFYPKYGVSDMQKLQMETQEGGNLDVCSVEGNFDACQTGVKNIFNDPEVNAAAEKNGIFFSSANSINFGRLIPQVAYYFYGYAEMVKSNEIRPGEQIDICVPTGNFGNILAAYFAKAMGLPAGRLICASNINNVLTDFFNTGIYDINRRFFTTMSPSMDILISSNLERLLYLLDGAENNSKYMSDLKSAGKFVSSAYLKSKLDETFTGMYCDEKNTGAAIKKVFDQYGYLIDTHTAVAFECAERYNSKNKTLVVSTASAYKFSCDVYRSLTGKAVDGTADPCEALRGITGVKIPEALRGLGARPKRFDNSVTADGMKDYVMKKLGG